MAPQDPKMFRCYALYAGCALGLLLCACDGAPVGQGESRHVDAAAVAGDGRADKDSTDGPSTADGAPRDGQDHTNDADTMLQDGAVGSDAAGTLTCSAVTLCTMACKSTDTACGLACRSRANPQAKKLLDDISNCVLDAFVAACHEPCIKPGNTACNSCTQTACKREFAACENHR